MPITFTYYHVELADHAMILAEGVPAETSLTMSTGSVSTTGTSTRRYTVPAPIPEMTLPRAKASRQVPMAVRQQIAARVALLGFTKAA